MISASAAPSPISSESPDDDLPNTSKPSVGPTPSFGDRMSSVEGGENRLYVLTLRGDVGDFLGKPRPEMRGKLVVKVGHAKQPAERCKAHNDHLPQQCAFRWDLSLQSTEFSGGIAAREAEDRLKARFDVCFKSLGGEFFLVDERRLAAEFAAITKDCSRTNGA